MCVLVNLLDIVVYSIVWLLLRRRAGQSNTMKKVFKSLAAIMVTVVVGWLLEGFVKAILLPLANFPISQWYYWESIFGIFINVASASNVFIMYTF
uniref:GtrA domain-containing protein n=3 Tax=Bursaphelenchus xylophilus TaxID=6326 RepID=A0A1I7SNQ2_BURXY